MNNRIFKLLNLEKWNSINKINNLQNNEFSKNLLGAELRLSPYCSKEGTAFSVFTEITNKHQIS